MVSNSPLSRRLSRFGFVESARDAVADARTRNESARTGRVLFQDAELAIEERSCKSPAALHRRGGDRESLARFVNRQAPKKPALDDLG